MRSCRKSSLCENGLNLIDFLKNVDNKIIDDDCTEIFLLLQLTTKGSAFVGVCGSVSMDLGVSVKESDKSGGLETGVELFAGAKAGADSTLALKMKLISDEDINMEMNGNRTALDAALEFGTEEAYKWGKVTCKEHDKIIEYLKEHGAKSGKELMEE